MDEDPDEMSPQILHRKSFLRAYLKKLCSDPTQMEFWEYLDKVGYAPSTSFPLLSPPDHPNPLPS
jgi:hypothetical protein